MYTDHAIAILISEFEHLTSTTNLSNDTEEALQVLKNHITFLNRKVKVSNGREAGNIGEVVTVSANHVYVEFNHYEFPDGYWVNIKFVELDK